MYDIYSYIIVPEPLYLNCVVGTKIEIIYNEHQKYLQSDWSKKSLVQSEYILYTANELSDT